MSIQKLNKCVTVLFQKLTKSIIENTKKLKLNSRTVETDHNKERNDETGEIVHRI